MEDLISGKAKRFLRSQGHHLTPVVQIGREGLTESLVAATDTALNTHEIIKVRVGRSASIDRKSASRELAVRTKSALVQLLGNTILLYRAHPEEPRIELP